MSEVQQSYPLSETQYDAVIIGTDLPQAVLAAALSLAGSRILHLDANGFYGGKWATIPLSQLNSFLETDNVGLIRSDAQSSDSKIREMFPDYELQELPALSTYDRLFPLGARVLSFSHSVELDHKIESCLLDLVPRPIMSSGEMVETLVRTNVGHYIDFRGVDGLYVQFPGSSGLQRVPGSRADVFQNSFVSMPEKRLLMRYVTKRYDDIRIRMEDNLETEDVESEDVESESGDHSFDLSIQEDMDAMKLTSTLQTFLTHSILFSVGKESFSKLDAMNAIYTYQASVMRFGTKTPFLYPNFGTGELSQAFCRLSAVHGGTYVLRRGATALIRSPKGIDRNKSESADHHLGVVTTAGDVVRTKYVFVSHDLMSQEKEKKADIWHAIAVLDGSVMKAGEPDRVMITVPRGTLGNKASAVRIRQVDAAVKVCPEGYYILYAETIEHGSTEHDIHGVLRNYVNLNHDDEFEQDGADAEKTEGEHQNGDIHKPNDSRAHMKPNCLWSISYSRTCGPSETDGTEGVVHVSASEMEHDMDEIIREAERCFRFVHPDREFLAPRNPEENTNEVLHSETGNGVQSPEAAEEEQE